MDLPNLTQIVTYPGATCSDTDRCRWGRSENPADAVAAAGWRRTCVRRS